MANILGIFMADFIVFGRGRLSHHPEQQRLEILDLTYPDFLGGVLYLRHKKSIWNLVLVIGHWVHLLPAIELKDFNMFHQVFWTSIWT